MSDESPATPVEIPEADEALLAQCRVETFMAGGPGGQHQNRTESAVRLIHLPTGLRVLAREERSQYRNRTKAVERLRAALEELNREAKPRVPTRVPRKQRKKRLAAKRRAGEKKRLRKPPVSDGE